MIPSNRMLHFIKRRIEEAVQNGFFHDRRVALFGCNSYSVFLRDFMREYGIEIHRIIDNDPKKQNKYHIHILISDPLEYVRAYPEVVIVICSGYYNSMIQEVKKSGFDTEHNVLNIPNLLEDLPENEDIIIATKKRRIVRGYKIYEELVRNAGIEYMLLFPYRGTGDVYMACSFLAQYLRKNNITEYVIVVNGSNCKDVVLLFGFDNVIQLESELVRDVLDAWQFLGNEIMNVKPLIHWGWRNKNTPYIFDNPEMSFTDMYRYDVFGLEDDDMPEHPIISRNTIFANKLFEENLLTVGKTVILAPYANSLKTDIAIELWEEIVQGLKKRGYTVATNCYGDEHPIRGTIGLSFPYKEAVSVLEQAGGFIALRSGLCDIVSQARCKIVIFYENNIRSTSYEHFSLSKMGLNTNEYAILFEKDEDIQKVFDVFS